MGCDLTKSEALSQIETVVKNHTDDYELTLFKRRPKSPLVKTLIFALKVKAVEENEDLFNEFAMLNINGSCIEIVESEIIIENKTRKEIFLIKVDVKITS